MTRTRKILKRGGRRKSRRFRNMRGGLQCNLNSHQPPWLTGLDFVNNRIKAQQAQIKTQQAQIDMQQFQITAAAAKIKNNDINIKKLLRKCWMMASIQERS